MHSTDRPVGELEDGLQLIRAVRHSFPPARSDLRQPADVFGRCKADRRARGLGDGGLIMHVLTGDRYAPKHCNDAAWCRSGCGLCGQRRGESMVGAVGAEDRSFSKDGFTVTLIFGFGSKSDVHVT